MNNHLALLILLLSPVPALANGNHLPNCRHATAIQKIQELNRELEQLKKDEEQVAGSFANFADRICTMSPYNRPGPAVGPCGNMSNAGHTGAVATHKRNFEQKKQQLQTKASGYANHMRALAYEDCANDLGNATRPFGPKIQREEARARTACRCPAGTPAVQPVPAGGGGR